MAYKLTDMTLFSHVDEGHVIISERGIYRQVDLYKRGETLFAAVRDGFVRLLDRGNTTVPHITWKDIEGVETVAAYDGPKQQSSSMRLQAAE